ncbi:uncharacterized protein LOC109863225 [Pseudomyrmex gracilis]|uniref:uncharacterized protein LOC109863225 n=1 Tax=Pseudomyrmex gracilis TaxID=219809 RepID=UPI000994EA25|nr:uncharacterized protein LOC109863225 [Pseudomyrmex gracilis]
MITSVQVQLKHAVVNYPAYASVLNFDGIEFPMTLHQIARFERNNNVSVNVFTAVEQGHGYVPLQLTSNKKEKHVNLLYVPDQHNGHVGHFAWIKQLSRLVSSQLSKTKRIKYICDRCLHYFHTSDKLAAHTVDCERLNNSAVILPAEGKNRLRFENCNNKERVPMVVYADLECVLEKQDKEENASSAHKYQRHSVFSIGYYASCEHIDIGYRSHRGENCVQWFVNELHELAKRAKTLFATNVPMANLTPVEFERFTNAECCHVCERPFEQDDMRVRDHCHLTGRFRRPAHSACNLNYKQVYVVPVVFHNLSGYDAHFIIKDVATAFEGEINVLPVTKETYISFTKHVSSTRDKDNQKCVQLRFIDSYKFLSTSLEKLASYLDKSELRVTRTEFNDLSTEDFELLTRKSVFPYEYVDNVDKLLETSLPPREAFYSSLTGETVTESEYAHATNRPVSEDVLLLADVFENFRCECLASYGLDPAHYYTLPGYTWDAMLKHTRVTFELLTDIDMVMFVERGIRGGLSQCSNRYARANNRYAQSYDLSEPTSYLMYYDVNNLYGWAMCQPLPYGNFAWVENAYEFDVTTVAANSNVGYILEVDLTYPKELHDAHRDLPFCPTREEPPGKHGKNHVKLLATVFNKKRYVIHYLNLQQYLRYGLRLTRIHRVLRFSQSPWLRGYIELNTRFRANATNEFAKNL